MKKRLIISIVFLLVFTPTIFAVENFNHVIANSEDWRDVYSIMLFSTLENAGADFLVSTGHGQILLNGIGREKDILVISSEDSPYVFNYPSLIQAENFASVQEIEIDSGNLDLIDELPEIKNFVVVGDSFGYNAVSAVPYASLTDSWVFLASRVNIGEIETILNRREVDNILIYGYVDTEVTQALENFNPTIINTGDRFEDNIKLVEMYDKIKDVRQVILTNGEFIEKEIMQGMNPILFTGRDNVPEKIADYIKSSDINVGVLIGNDLIGAATNIRRSTGISVMVKFARGARQRTSSISAVEGLDLFYLPVPTLDLEIYSIKYNRANSQLEVTYKSNSNMPAYLKGTINLVSDSGTLRLGDLDSVFISPGDLKTIVYDGVEIAGEELQGEYYTIYGESSSSMDRILEGIIEVGIVSVLDSCQMEIKYVKYNKQEKAFVIKVENTAEVECWVDIELKDISINNIKQTIGTKGSENILPGKSKKILISQIMVDYDLKENSFVNLVSYYGERRDSLVNLYKGRFELGSQRFTILTYIIIFLIIIIILLLLFFLILRRREDDDEYY